MANLGIRRLKITEEERDLIFSLWNQGYNCTQISKYEGITVSYMTIRKILGIAFNLSKR